MGLAATLNRVWARHRTAILAAGGTTAVGAAVVIKKHGTTSSSSTTGYPAATATGTVPTYDTTSTDTGAGGSSSGAPDYAAFTDQLSATQDWQQSQFDALNANLGGLSDSLTTIAGDLSAAPTRAAGPTKAPASPRPKKPKAKPKAQIKPPAPAKKTAAPRKLTNPRRPTGRPRTSNPIKPVPPKPKRSK